MNDFLYQIEGRNPHFSQKEKRVIKFRAKSKNTNEWVTGGYYYTDNNKNCPINSQPLITKHYIMTYYSGDWNMGGWENVEIFQNTPLRIHVSFNGLFIHVVQQIEIEIVHAALLQLLFENGGGIIVADDLVAGIFGGQIIGRAGIFLQDFSDHDFGKAVVIGPGGIKIVDALCKCLGKHLSSCGFVHYTFSVGNHGKTHTSQTQGREFFAFKIFINHSFTPFSFYVLILT